MNAGVPSYSSFTIDRDFQVRFFGWALLFLWVAAMVYIARDFFFPSFYRAEIHETKYDKDESYGKWFKKFIHCINVILRSIADKYRRNWRLRLKSFFYYPLFLSK